MWKSFNNTNHGRPNSWKESDIACFRPPSYSLLLCPCSYGNDRNNDNLIPFTDTESEMSSLFAVAVVLLGKKLRIRLSSGAREMLEEEEVDLLNYFLSRL